MKKYLFAVLILSVVVLSSCTTNNNNPTAVTNYLVAEFQNGTLPYAGYQGCTDANFASGASVAGNNYGTQPEGSFGYYDATAGITRYVVRFDVGSLPAGIKVKKAFLTMYSYYVYGTGSFSAHEKTAGWLDTLITWNNSSGGETFNASPMSTVAMGTANYYTFALDAAVVQSWINDSSYNYGVLLKGVNESAQGYLWCYFANEAYVSYRPKLTVYYTID